MIWKGCVKVSPVYYWKDFMRMMSPIAFDENDVTDGI